MSKTQENLMAAFAGESQANRKYLAYAKQAEKEGMLQVAKLFRAAAEAETIHAHAHLHNAGKIKNTLENLEDAIAGETYEFTTMYPGMIADADSEDKAARSQSASPATSFVIASSISAIFSPAICSRTARPTKSIVAASSA